MDEQDENQMERDCANFRGHPPCTIAQRWSARVGEDGTVPLAAIEKTDQGGRPPVLDEKKRLKIIALVANGSSRRVAARVVGCSYSTIARTAVRDPLFAADLEAAEQNVEIEALRHIREAAKTGRYWRASAWLLERRNPRDFAKKTPATLSEEDVAHIALRLADPLIYKLSDEEFDDFQEKAYEFARALYESNELAKYLPIPPPPKPDYVCRKRSQEGFAPHDSNADDPPSDQPSPQAFALDELAMLPTDAAETQS